MDAKFGKNLQDLIHPVTKKFNHGLYAKHTLGQDNTDGKTCIIEGYEATCIDPNKTNVLILGVIHGL